MIRGPKKTISIVIPVELYEELNALAGDTSRSMSAYLRQVIKAHLQYMARFQKP